jgi:hypothetical protein
LVDYSPENAPTPYGCLGRDDSVRVVVGWVLIEALMWPVPTEVAFVHSGHGAGVFLVVDQNPVGAFNGGDPTVLIDLPAYPDNVSSVGDGTYWVALPSPRVAIAERLLPYPNLRRLAVLLPDRLQHQPKRYSVVALVDGSGQVLRSLHGPSGRYHMITGMRQHGDTLWLSSLTQPAIARVPL